MDKELIDYLIYLLNKSYFTKITLRGFYDSDIDDLIDKYSERGIDEFSYDVDMFHGGTGKLRISFRGEGGHK